MSSNEELDPIKLEDMRQKNGDRISMLSQDETKLLFDVLGIMDMPKADIPYLKALLNERFSHLITLEGEKKKERTEPFQPPEPIPE